MNRRSLVSLLAAAACLVTANATRAQAGGPSFAVLSEIAREVRVVTYRPDVGTRLGANQEDRLPLSDGALDKLALVTAKSALQKASPGAPVWLIAPMDSDLFDPLDNFIEGSRLSIPADLAQALKEHGTTRLLLLSRHRAEARLSAAHGKLGSGQIEGVGFFVDHQASMTNQTTLVSSTGFIAPYLYMRATLIDLPGGTVLKSRRILQSSVRAAQQAEQSGDPWNVLSSEQKVRMLADMIVKEVTQAVPALLASP